MLVTSYVKTLLKCKYIYTRVCVCKYTYQQLLRSQLLIIVISKTVQ